MVKISHHAYKFCINSQYLLMWICLSLNNLLVTLALDGTLLLAANYFNVAGRAQERVDATMSAVSAAALLRGLVDLDVLDDERVQVQTLGLGVALSVLQETQEELGTLFGPATLGNTPGLSLSTATNTTVEAAEGNALLLLADVIEEGLSLAQRHTSQNRSSLTGVLEVNTEVVSAGLAGLGFVIGFERVRHGWIYKDGWNPNDRVDRLFLSKALPGSPYLMTMDPCPTTDLNNDLESPSGSKAYSAMFCSRTYRPCIQQSAHFERSRSNFHQSIWGL